MSFTVLPLLTCPACGAPGALRENSDAIACGECDQQYPRVGGIPVLLPNPDAMVEEWCFEADELTRDNERSRTRILAQLAGEDLGKKTRVRLQTIHEHLLEHRERLLSLLRDGGIVPRERARPDAERVPGEGTITAYYHQLHRDWGWTSEESQENQAALEQVTAVVEPGTDLGKVLVLGAGGCRLPVDIHTTYATTLTLAVDINPLPFLVAARVLAGERLPMFEFPISPRTSERAVVERDLQREGDTVTGFELAFADGLDPPVVKGAFDTVITPWFIDQVPRNMVTFLPRLHRALREGGRWINTGPLIYHPSHTMLAHRYRMDEVLELVEAAGFSVTGHAYPELPYMVSPVGSQGRTERILTFEAIKTGEPQKAAESVNVEPAWTTRDDVPIELMAGLEGYTPPHPMFAAVASLIDGHRTVADIAEILVRKHGLPAEAAAGGVRACLVEIRRALARG